MHRKEYYSTSSTLGLQSINEANKSRKADAQPTSNKQKERGPRVFLKRAPNLKGEKEDETGRERMKYVKLITRALYLILLTHEKLAFSAPVDYYFITYLVYTGSVQSFTIPANVSSIYVELCGGDGGSYSGNCAVPPCTG